MKKNSLSWSISLALLGGAVALVPHSVVFAEEAPAPYTLKIISHGEGNPQADNDTPVGMQQNRRVDVSLKTKVPVRVPDLPAPVAAAAKPAAVLRDGEEVPEPERVDSGGGTFWVSEDPTSFKKLLGLEVPEKVNLIADGELENPVQFLIATNYGKFIDRWQVLILAEGSAVDDEPLYSFDGALSGSMTKVEWKGEFASGRQLQTGDKYDVALRVYDEDGNFDQIASSGMAVVSDGQIADNSADLIENLAITKLRVDLKDMSREFVQQSISVAGSTVVLRGTDLAEVQSVDINGEQVAIEEDESFAIEYILPPGDHQFNVNSMRKSGEESRHRLDVEVKPGHFFIVGLADLTVGENSIRGSVEPLAADDDHFGGDIFVDGRLAFYLKGKVQGLSLIHI